jgi:hypothetical protein
MNGTPLSKKCEILHDFYLDYAGTDEYEDFFRLNDLGVPAALLYMNGGAQLTEIGANFVEEAWIAMCELLEVDHLGDYESLEQIAGLDD